MILVILTHNNSVILRFTILLAVLTTLLHAAPRKSELQRELEKISSYKEGAKAMADHLPDMAITQFRTTLANEKLSQTAKPYVTLALSEALIRSSLTPQGHERQANEALQLLETEQVKKMADTPIWKAEALASLGRYQDAETTLSAIDKKHSRYQQVQLSRARILIALNRQSDALAVLTPLFNISAAPTRVSAQLLATEIMIGQGLWQDAQKLLDNIDSPTPASAQLREYLKAQLSLMENKAVEAISQFRALVTQPDHLSEKIFHASFLGLADALAANNQNEDAIATLEDFINKYPDSSILQQIFQRLSKLLPNNLPTDHPSMMKLIGWSSSPQVAKNILYISGNTADSIQPYQPAPSEHDDLVSLSLYLRAKLLAASGTTEKINQSLILLNQLRSQHPGHSLPPTELYLELASASLLDTAHIQLQREQNEQAAFTLASMEKAAFSPILKDRASFFLGQLLAGQNDFSNAHTAFDFSRASNDPQIARAANINAGITALLSSQLKVFDSILTATRDAHIRISLQLERALWKCRNNDVSGRIDLDTFIMANLGHARENEARLALAAASVDIMPADIQLAKTQLDIIAPRLTDATHQYNITRILIRAEELNQQWKAAAEAAEEYIRRFSQSPHLESIMLKQGEAYYHNEDFNAARRIFQTITSQYPEGKFTPYARFYTAMAARLGGTTQAREESIALFQEIIDSKHTLASEARIQQGRVLIDLLRYTEAEKSLQPLLKDKSTHVALRRDAGILLADCFHRQATNNPEKYSPQKFEQAVSIYNELLTKKDISAARKNQIHFLRGQTLQSMNKMDQALESYYSVIAQANAPDSQSGDEVEWFWFYRCGFKALSILESEQRWEASVKLAHRIASFNGSRAEEALKRAHSLAKTHMIWEKQPMPAAQENGGGSTDKDSN